MAKETVQIPDELSTNPITLACPFCKAKVGQDCATSSGGFSILHVARIKAAALRDRTRKRKARRG
jgi:hypothetical protein